MPASSHVAVRALVRQELGEVRTDADRAYARAATAVRNAEGFVQVQVRTSPPNAPGAATPTSAFMLAPST
jgi:hypothetical protein